MGARQLRNRVARPMDGQAGQSCPHDPFPQAQQAHRPRLGDLPLPGGDQHLQAACSELLPDHGEGRAACPEVGQGALGDDSKGLKVTVTIVTIMAARDRK